MTHTRRNSSILKSPRAGFTLIELLIVLAIIGLLAAILFPAFKRAQEGGHQASCASNMKQIYQAVMLYKQDEKVYPASLAVLLPKDFDIANPQNVASTVNGQNCVGATCPNAEGTGYFKGGRDALVCPDDDTDPSVVRSSYGDISTEIRAPMTSGGNQDDMGRYVWNYWGYRGTNGPSCTPNTTNVSECAGTAALQTDDAAYKSQFQSDPKFRSFPASGFDPATNPVAVEKLPRLANRFAPTSTIITHCVYHRLPTASGKIAFPYEVTTDPNNGAMARDIVLRLDGSARVLDISKFHDPSNLGWAKQNF